MDMTFTDAALAVIRRYEGLRLTSYRCPAGKWTVGYGHTQDVRPGMTISPSEAEALLHEDAEVAADSVRRIVKVPLKQHEFDALVSFLFNIGEGRLTDTNTLRLLNEGRREAFLNMHGRWVRSNGKVLPGLISRREAEAKLFRGEA